MTYIKNCYEYKRRSPIYQEKKLLMSRENLDGVKIKGALAGEDQPKVNKTLLFKQKGLIDEEWTFGGKRNIQFFNFMTDHSDDQFS